MPDSLTLKMDDAISDENLRDIVHHNTLVNDIPSSYTDPSYTDHNQLYAIKCGQCIKCIG
ncbi:MAG: hypothetical protein AAGA66_20120 [Bacteroidota bacterium]